MKDGPAYRYYRSLEGRWSGDFALRVTDRRGLRRATAPLAARYALATMGAFFRLFGAVRMKTTLFAAPDGAAHDFDHTTRIEKAGLLLGLTSEQITIGADGRSLRMIGEQHFAPITGRPEHYDSDGEVNDAATGATYRIPWLGLSLVQRTAVVPEGLELVQETPWSSGRVLLVRAG